MAWDLSRPDWEERLLAGQSLMPDNLPINKAVAARAIGIFNKLKLSKVPETPSLGDAAGEWFREIVAALLGSIDPVTKWRMIRGLFLMVPKKNGKTAYAAALMLTALLMNRRPRAEFILTGPSHDITELSFDEAVGMIQLDSFLRKRLDITPSAKEITDLKNGAVLAVKTFGTKIVTGRVVAGALLEEIHELGKRADAASIIGQIRGGMVSVPEAFFAMITTQSDKTPAGVFKSELAVARAVRDGRSKVDTLPIIYEYPERLQKDRAFWENPGNWPVITPNLGRSIWIPRLELDLEEARQKGDAEVQRWITQHLNIQPGLGLHTDSWAGADFWEGATDEALTFAKLLERCEVIDVGIDGGGLDDLLGFTVAGRCRETKKILTWSKAWAHTSVLRRRKSEAPTLLDFEKDGDLIIVKMISDAYVQVAELVRLIHEAGLLDKVGVDPAGVGGIITALKDVGIPEEIIEGVSQGWRLSGSIKDTEGMLSDGVLFHANQPLMLWCAGNAKVEQSGNAMVITKKQAGTAKIDPLVALFTAIALLRLNPAAPDGTIPADFELTVWA